MTGLFLQGKLTHGAQQISFIQVKIRAKFHTL